MNRLIDGLAARVIDNLKGKRTQIVERLGVRPERHTLCQLQIEHQNVEPALRCNFGVELAQRARRRVSGVGKERLSELFLRLVERFKAGARHIYLAPDDEPRRRVLQMQRNGAHGLEVFRHIFADEPVASRRAADKLAVYILECHREPIDFWLNTVRSLRLIFSEALVKLPQLVIGKHVLQALERHLMTDLHKLRKRRAADAPRRAVGQRILRVLRLKLLESAELVVIVVVRHLRRVLHIV